LQGKASREDGIPLPADVREAFIATGITNARAEGYNGWSNRSNASPCGFRNPHSSARRI
jgi:hypothetical protein